MRARLLVLVIAGALAAQWGRRMEDHPEFLPKNPDHEYSFTRMMYRGVGRRAWSWTTDYPKADFQFMMGVKRLSRIDSHEAPVTMPIDDPRLFQYPFIYAVEVGYLSFSETEAARIREYLLRGGFFVVDDFHGTYEWANFEHYIKMVFPDRPIVELEMTHPIFQCHFSIKEKIQVPGAQYLRSGQLWEKDGVVPRHRAIFDDDGRIMVMINHNMDLGDAWEWADVPEYEERFTTQAYHLGINYIVYSMTH